MSQSYLQNYLRQLCCILLFPQKEELKSKIILTDSPYSRLSTDDIFKRIFVTENIWITNKIPFKYVPFGLIDNMLALVQTMAWRCRGDIPMPETILTQFNDAYMIYAALGRDELTHWGRDKVDAISQTTFSSAFSWMKMFELRLKFHWSLFLRVQSTIFQHWFR